MNPQRDMHAREVCAERHRHSMVSLGIEVFGLVNGDVCFKKFMP